MASFPADRDYAMSYMSEINKCDYVQMALSAYRNSPRGNVEKRAFLVVLENCRSLFAEQIVVTNDGMGQLTAGNLIYMYDLACLVTEAYSILRSTENWELQEEFDEAHALAEMREEPFVHPLRGVRDAFGFVVGSAFRDWFDQNSGLLDLYRRLEDRGDYQVHIRPFTVDEDFVWQWESAYQPEPELHGPLGYWIYHVGEGWECVGYDD